MDRERYMATLQKDIETYMRRVMRPKLKDISVDTMSDGDKVVFRFPKDTGEPRNVFLTLPHADPLAYYSLLIWTTRKLMGEMLIISKNDDYLHRVYELFYLCMRCYSGVTFHEVVSCWLQGGVNPLKANKKGVITGPNFIRRYFEECKIMGTHPKNATMCRFQHSETTDTNWFGGLENEDVQVNKEIEKIRHAVGLANGYTLFDGNKKATNRDVLKKVQEVREIGGVKSLSFYSIWVFLGLIHTDHGKQQGMENQVEKGSAFIGYLKKVYEEYFLDQTSASMSDLASRIMKRISYNLGVTWTVGENVACKMGRALIGAGLHVRELEDANGNFIRELTEKEKNQIRSKGDVFVEGQLIYRIDYVPTGPRPITTWQKKKGKE